MNKNWAAILILIITLIGYSLVGFTYVHSNFPSKDIFKLVCDKLEIIDMKLDKLILREGEKENGRY